MQQKAIRLTKIQTIVYGSVILCSGFLALLYLSESALVLTEPLSKPALIKSMRSQEIDAYPAITPQIILMRNHLQPLKTNTGKSILPLGGIAKKNTVFCRETGDMIVYNSDRFGFRNKDAVWDENLEVIAVGDSFVQGACVNDEEHLVSALRSRWPNTLNLGSFGNGPLANLATISEYALSKKPKYILWFYVANDLAIDLPLEERSSILSSYMKNQNFSQKLATSQENADEALATFLLAEIERLSAEAKSGFTIGGFLQLEHLQDKLRRLTEKVFAPAAPDFPNAFDYDRQESIDYNRHSHIVAEAAGRAQLVGSELIFVLVPDARMFRPTTSPDVSAQKHVERVISSIASFGIPTIDLYAELRKEKNPMRFFAGLGGYYGHFNKDGYKKVGNALVTQLADIEKKQKLLSTSTAPHNK